MVLQKKSTISFIFIALLLTTTFSCRQSKRNFSTIPVDATLIPSMHTENAYLLISDSGITRYRIQAKIWDDYSNQKEPYMHCPEGFLLERFDSLFNIEFSIKADTVYYYKEKGLWRAIDNVLAKNMDGVIFETSELFFNEKVDPDTRGAIYTEKFIRIEENEGKRIQMGYGMESNASLNDFRISSYSNRITIEEKDSIASQENSSLENTNIKNSESNSDQI